MKAYMLQLCIFDDYDVAPTCVHGMYVPSMDGLPDEVIAQELYTLTRQMKTEARKAYGGRRYPPMAMFWMGEAREVDTRMDVANGETRH